MCLPQATDFLDKIQTNLIQIRAPSRRAESQNTITLINDKVAPIVEINKCTVAKSVEQSINKNFAIPLRELFLSFLMMMDVNKSVETTALINF